VKVSAGGPVADEFRRWTRSLATACLLCTRDGDILAANPAARALLDGDPAGTHLADWVAEPPEHLPPLFADFAASTQRSPARLTLERDGTHLPLRVHGARLPWGDGYRLLLQLTPLSAPGDAFRRLNRELAELRRRQRALARDKARLEELVAEHARRLDRHLRLQGILLETVDEAIVAIDEAGVIRTFNRAAQEIFGYRPEEVIGRNVACLVDPDHAPFHDAYIRRYLDSGEARLIGKGLVEVTARTRDGRLVPVELTLAEAEGEAGRLFVAAMRDISERKRQEALIEAHLHALEKANQELMQFAYVASHDLKAPLRAISNLAEWIEEDLEGRLEAEQKHQFDLLRRRVRRMEALIEGLLQYSRVGRTEGRRERVEVAALLAEVVDSLDPPAGFRVHWEDMPVLHTDRLRLFQVFSNLIGNAVKYHHDPAHGRVEVLAEDLGERVRFTVADDGPGIDPRFHDKVFQVFQTLQARDTMESTGIGLALVKKIVEGEGGTIELQSRAGAGARFRFTWPKGSDTS